MFMFAREREHPTYQPPHVTIQHHCANIHTECDAIVNQERLHANEEIHRNTIDTIRHQGNG